MGVKAKFKCLSITEFENQKEVALFAAYGPGNEDYAKFTPSGSLKIMVNDETKASDYFKPGKHYILDIQEDVEKVVE